MLLILGFGFEVNLVLLQTFDYYTLLVCWGKKASHKGEARCFNKRSNVINVGYSVILTWLS